MKIRYEWLAVLFLSILPDILLAQGTFTDAMREYEAGQYGKAQAIFSRLAQLGQHDSQHNLAVMYLHGQGVEKDLSLSYAWALLAAESGDAVFIKTRDTIKKNIADPTLSLALSRAEELKKRYGLQALNMSLLPELVAADISGYCNIKRTSTKMPEYPLSALRVGQQGWVDLEFTLGKDGSVRDVIAIEPVLGDPAFAKSAYKSFIHARYEKPQAGGKSVEVFAAQSKIIFRIEMDGNYKYQRKLDAYYNDLKTKAEAGHPGYQYMYAYIVSSHPDLWEKLTPQQVNEWFLKAAQAGVREAQYRMGWSLLYGQGCKADNSKAIEWITKSAQADYPHAQLLLANALLYVLDKKPEYQEKALFWLEKAAERKFMPAQMKLAWILSTNAETKYRDGKRALGLVEALVKTYPDEVTAHETWAAVLAETGDFKQAIKKQEKAIDRAEDLKWDLAPLQARLAMYEQNKPWRE